jgi:RHS repeat-associated protein
MSPKRSNPIKNDAAQRGLILGFLASGALVLAGNVFAQFCPGATTYFASNYSLPSCNVGTCWSATPLAGSTAVTGSTYPSTNYACATATPSAGAQENTLYAYDNNGNLLTTRDPLGHPTGNIFDALNRLTQVLDPNLGTTTYTYDGANNLTQVSDARGSATSYTYDGLNNLTKLASHDTGTTNNTYDAAGNVLTKTDARGAVATYTYDVLNRVTQIIYSKSGTPSESHMFTYDSGANAKGRLSAVTDPSAVTSWTYNSQGRVASKTQQVGSLVRSVAYAYNAAGQVTTITTPSGQQIGYGYTNNRVSSITINGSNLLTGANTKPFGPLSAWHWGNGLFTFRDYDTDGRLADWEFRNGTSILRKNQIFDAASRITAIADPNTPAASQVYQYDVLDRLTIAQSGIPVTHTQQFSYDAVGNRQNATIDGAVANLTYAQAGNQLQTMVGAVSVSYFNGASALTFAYNNANRMMQVQSSGVAIGSYAVSALGQRLSKTAAGVVTGFVYDEQGRLLGEYDQSGNLIQETVWLEDLPVATLRPTGTGNPAPIAIYYVHADHLGSPRAVTRPSDNAIMWQWDNADPFGVNAADENPSGQGSFKYAMRFPGQYYDQETGTHYNYFRDYDSTNGRYEQSDPIGLNGGLNTYGYAGADPEDRIDPNGLAWLCTAPLHVAPRLDFGGHGPAHHEYVCDTPQHCGGQDWSREPWYGNPILGPGIPSVGDRFNPGRCTKIQPDNQCMNDCLAKEIDNPGRPPYSVVPRFSWSIAPNCQEWAEAIVQKCRPGCLGKK